MLNLIKQKKGKTKKEKDSRERERVRAEPNNYTIMSASDMEQER